MRDRDLFASILGIDAPWRVTQADVELARGEARDYLDHRADPAVCPGCGGAAPGYDHCPLRWRHLDICQYRTLLIAEVPRVECPEHGVHQIRVPWGAPGLRFTALFGALIPDAERKIAFDRFHVAQHLAQAVNQVRRQAAGAQGG